MAKLKVFDGRSGSGLDILHPSAGLTVTFCWELNLWIFYWSCSNFLHNGQAKPESLHRASGRAVSHRGNRSHCYGRWFAWNDPTSALEKKSKTSLSRSWAPGRAGLSLRCLCSCPAPCSYRKLIVLSSAGNPAPPPGKSSLVWPGACLRILRSLPDHYLFIGNVLLSKGLWEGKQLSLDSLAELWN